MPFHGAINQFMRSRYREEYGLPRSRPHRSVLLSRNHCCTVATVMV